MQSDGLFDFVPLWGVFIGTLLLVLLSVEGGYLWARYKKRSEVEKEAPVGAMVGALLGLLAFLLAFTFSMAADNFHARKLALLDEANAIKTTYLLADLIEEPHRTEVRKILLDYVQERLQWSRTSQKSANTTSSPPRVSSLMKRLSVRGVSLRRPR